MIRKTATTIALLLCLFATPVLAQSSSALLADRLEVSGNRLIASGNVEIWIGQQRVTARKLVYDQAAETMVLTGPIRLQTNDGITIFASAAELDARVQSAILNDARLVLEDRLQMAAVQIRRPDTRYTEMFKVAATSCYVCNGQTPIWQIRAKRIVHDAQEQQIYLEQAQFRFFDIPVLYLPWFRLPDPALERASGFLNPRLKNNTLLGVGLKIPYFLAIGQDKDLTITPYISSETRTLQLRYRQAFQYGNLTVDGAVTRDDVLPDQTRAYLFADASFALPRDFTLNLDVKATSDPSYLREYLFSTEDRLHSFAEVTRSNARSHADLRLSAYQSLRQSEDNGTIPTIVFEANSERRVFPASIGGEARYQLSLQTAYRYSDLDTDGPDQGTEVDGFDIARASLRTEWDRNWQFTNGMVADVSTQLAADGYIIQQHAGFDDFVGNTNATASVGLEWALQKRTTQGTHILTPRVQYQVADGTNNAVPNQDSTRVEFDEGNLFALTRSPGFDLQDSGNRLTFGIDWDYLGTAGNEYGATLGRIWRDVSNSGFSDSSGLSGTRSDWLIGANWQAPSGLDLLARAIVNDAGQVNKAEARLNLDRNRYAVDAIFTFLNSDPAEARPDSVSELALSAQYQLQQDWTVSTDLRYDFQVEDIAAAQVGLQFRNECIDVNLTVTRQFPSTSTGRASNDYGLTVELLGFGAGDTPVTGHKTCGG